MSSILFYVNSHYGLGHYYRIYNIARALRNRYPSIKLTILYSGVPCEIFRGYADLKIVYLPGFTYWGDKICETIIPFDQKENIQGIFKKRVDIIKQIFDGERFKVLVTEYLPFAKHQLANELLNIIGLFKKKCPAGYIVSSVRDIIHNMDKDKLIFAETLIHNYFNYILVHSDPIIIKLDESYGDISRFEKKIVYTGFVTSEDRNFKKPQNYKRKPSIIVSTGGGHDGYHLLKSFLIAFQKLKVNFNKGTYVNIFPGPFIPKNDLNVIQEQLQFFQRNNVKIRNPYEYCVVRNNATFSISMCGYNTCFDLLVRKIPSIFFPRQRKEQLIRTKLLVKFKVAETANDVDELAEVLKNKLIRRESFASNINMDFNGAKKTADFLALLCR